MQLTINNTGEVMTFANGREAVEFLSGVGLIPKPTTDKYNPFMLLQGPVRRGLITVTGADSSTAVPPVPIQPAVPAPVQTSIPMQPAPMPVQPPAQQTKPRPSESLDTLGQFAALLQNYMPQQPQQAVNMDEVKEAMMETIRKQGAEILQKCQELIGTQAPRQVEIKIADKPPILTDAILHPKFNDLLTAACCPAFKGVWLSGPAGSGKTTAAAQVAKCMDLPFYTISVCSQSTKVDLFGYMNAVGEYIPSLFYQAYKNGGVFLLDEIDNGNANVLAALNAALSNGHCAFPCGMVEKNDNFHCIAGANTIGTGATQQYSGRNPIDGATLDRFFYITWQYDEANEGRICGNETFAKKIQALRKKAIDKGLRVIISPRASINGAALLAMGMDEETVLEGLIYAKINENDRKTLMA